MRIFLIFLFISCYYFGSTSSANPDEVKTEESQSQFKIFLFNPSVRWMRSTGVYESFKEVKNLSAGFKYDDYGINFEYQFFKNISDSGSTRFELEHKEYLLWLEYYYLNFDFVGFYAGAAGGSYSDRVRTQFMDEISEESSRPRDLFGFKLGGEIQSAPIFKKNGLTTALEIQSLYGKNLDPNPNINFVLKIGVFFN